MKNTGLGTPFINVSFTGFLWGYNDELPCISMSRPDVKLLRERLIYLQMILMMTGERMIGRGRRELLAMRWKKLRKLWT